MKKLRPEKPMQLSQENNGILKVSLVDLFEISKEFWVLYSSEHFEPELEVGVFVCNSSAKYPIDAKVLYEYFADCCKSSFISDHVSCVIFSDEEQRSKTLYTIDRFLHFTDVSNKLFVLILNVIFL